MALKSGSPLLHVPSRSVGPRLVHRRNLARPESSTRPKLTTLLPPRCVGSLNSGSISFVRTWPRRCTRMSEPVSTTLYFGPWYRRSPFFDATIRHGAKAFDIYNHMYLPAEYDDPVKEYWHLLNHVTIWDVSVERVVEIHGPDAVAFSNMLTCRDLTKCEVGQGKYAPILAEDGGIINDPVMLRVDADRFWFCLADSDAGLWARALTRCTDLEVQVSEPPVFPVQVQGPRSKDVMQALFRDRLPELQYYRCARADL